MTPLKPVALIADLKLERILQGGFVMEATPPATPRHTMFPLWLLPSGSDQVACQHAR